MQKFRVDFEGSKTLQMNSESTFTFKIPRYADLLMDCYLSVALPHIWSPILPPVEIIDSNGLYRLGAVRIQMDRQFGRPND